MVAMMSERILEIKARNREYWEKMLSDDMPLSLRAVITSALRASDDRDTREQNAYARGLEDGARTANGGAASCADRDRRCAGETGGFINVS